MFTYQIQIELRDSNLRADMKWEAVARTVGQEPGGMERSATGYTASGAARAAVEWLVQDLMRRDHTRGGR